jgi:hypothetical protein
MNQERARADGFLLFCIGMLLFLAMGFLMLAAQRGPGLDFQHSYISPRCLLEHRDPYKLADMLLVYQEHGGKIPPACCGDTESLLVEMHYAYLPTIFAVTGLVAVFPIAAAFWIWTALAAGSFLIAAALIWEVGSSYSPRLTGALLCLFLLNSGTLICTGNPASLALSLGVIGAACILRERAVVPGLICLAAGLAMKPQNSGFIWLALVLLGGTSRKRALQSLGVLFVISLPWLVRTWQVAPQWPSEFRANVAALLGQGAVNDPGPAAVLKRGTLTFTNLQSVLSLIHDDPRFYNSASFAIGALLLGILVFLIVRFKASAESRWILIASFSALTLLPVYHRQYDSKLLILTIPACALLWSRKDRLGKFALLVTCLGLLAASDLVWAIYITLTADLHLTGITQRLYFLSRAVPVPCTIALVAVFYAFAFAQWSRQRQVPSEASMPQHS